MNGDMRDGNHIYRVDKFKVPAAAREEFLSRVRTSIITIAIWQNERAFSSAKSIVQEHYKKTGFNPAETIFVQLRELERFANQMARCRPWRTLHALDSYSF